MFRYAFLFIIGVLALAWMPHARASASLLGETARCTTETLGSNHLTYQDARRLRIGRTLEIAGSPVILGRGDTIWGLCRNKELASLSRAAALAKDEARIKELETRLADEGAQARAAEQDAGEARRALAAVIQARTDTQGALDRASERETRLWYALTALVVITALLALALAFFAFRGAHRLRAIYGEVQRAESMRSMFRRIAPFLTLDSISYTLAADAVEQPASLARRTFLIELTKIIRQEEKIEVYCTLPWGEQALYEPSKVTRLLRSPRAKAYYQKERDLALKEDMFGRRMLAADLPDYYLLIASAAGCAFESGLRYRAAEAAV